MMGRASNAPGPNCRDQFKLIVDSRAEAAVERVTIHSTPRPWIISRSSHCPRIWPGNERTTGAGTMTCDGSMVGNAAAALIRSIRT